MFVQDVYVLFQLQLVWLLFILILMMIVIRRTVVKEDYKPPAQGAREKLERERENLSGLMIW